MYALNEKTAARNGMTFWSPRIYGYIIIVVRLHHARIIGITRDNRTIPGTAVFAYIIVLHAVAYASRRKTRSYADRNNDVCRVPQRSRVFGAYKSRRDSISQTAGRRILAAHAEADTRVIPLKGEENETSYL